MHYGDARYIDPTPAYILIAISIGLCTYFFWVGTVCVRLWFYRGALGPEPEKFIIVPQHRKKRKQQAEAEALRIKLNKRSTLFPHVAHIGSTNADPFADEAFPVVEDFAAVPVINIEGTESDDENDPFEDFEEPEKVRKYIAEQRRISRLPAFVQDDCGSGAEFPDVPVSLTPVEKEHSRSEWHPAHRLRETKTYMQLGLRKIRPNEWLLVDNSYLELHEARMSLLDEKSEECIQVRHDGEAACQELMDVVTHELAIKYPERFTVKIGYGTKKICNEYTGKQYSLLRPLDCPPLEVCARLAVEDFNIFAKDEFTLQWYLQASATLFPAGWRMRTHIGKSLNAIINNIDASMTLWSDLPDILNLPHTASTPYIRTSTFIQTAPSSSPYSPPLPSTLFIQRPVDFFTGTIHNLDPSALFVRRETQIFKLLPKSGAVVMSTRTCLRPLMELDGKEKRELLREVKGWGEEEARFKGRDLWIWGVEGWVEGRRGNDGGWLREDGTVVGGDD